ncbi:MAG: hypothetical protein PHH68_02315 [Candidatus Omnitrophica bacterium]|jgi:hypothetical protein|nr:hypothetical protein [Candidatus Omnitrophota bacterium]MDD5079145.1 hypothetical protein [Candidatus Omnitrophota bacterium]
MSKKNTRISLIAILFFIAAELLLRLFGWGPAPHVYEEILDPEIQWLHTAGFKGRVWETDIEISPQRIRDRIYSINKPKYTFRVIAVGECTVFGRAVALEESFVKRLEVLLNERKPFKNINDYEVINAGCGQYNDLQKEAFLEKYWMRYNPDLIIFGHDLGSKVWLETRLKLRWFSLIRDRTPKQLYSARFLVSLIERFIIAPVALKMSHYDEKNTVLTRYTGEGLRHIKTDQALKRLSLLSRKTDVPAIIVFVPWLGDLSEGSYPHKWVHELYKKKCAKSNLDVLDLYDVYFKNKQCDLFWVSDANRRPNALAHKIIAEEVYQEIVKRASLPKK